MKVAVDRIVVRGLREPIEAGSLRASVRREVADALSGRRTSRHSDVATVVAGAVRTAIKEEPR